MSWNVTSHAGRVGRPDLWYYGDGQRGCSLDRHGAVRGHQACVPEFRRRNLFPLRPTSDPGGYRGRGRHHVQDPLQLDGCHDWWTGRLIFYRRTSVVHRPVSPGGQRGDHHRPRCRLILAHRSAIGCRGVEPEPHRRGTGEVGWHRRRHCAHQRPGVCCRAASRPQTWSGPDADQADRYQPPHL